MTGLLGENSLGISLDSRTSVIVALATAAAVRDEVAIRQAVADALADGINNNEILDIMTVAARIQQSINLNNILQGIQGAPAAASAGAVAGTPRRRRGRPPGRRSARSQAEPPTPEPSSESASDAEDIAAAFSSREDFWDQLVASFQARMPDARLSRTQGPR